MEELTKEQVLRLFSGYTNNSMPVMRAFIDLFFNTVTASQSLPRKQFYSYVSQSGIAIPYSCDYSGNAISPVIDTINGVFTYISPGVYRYTKAGAFADISKVIVSLGNSVSPVIGTRWQKINDDTIEINTFTRATFTYPISVETPANNLLNANLFNIQIFE